MKKILTLLFIFMAFSIQAETAYWIDVRTASEHSSGHIEGSMNIPHGDIAEQIATVTKDKDAEIHLYCRSGGRAGKALKALTDLGYTNVTNEGGYSALKMKQEQESKASMAR
jgi:phage shock protein E|tara:strand:+ start:1357 stop:1692 length:336 start_codon:yes stop_codon:yes gene_type:complete